MNSLQFAFRVREGDFLGLLAHNWGIEFDKNKVKAKINYNSRRLLGQKSISCEYLL